MVRLIKTVYASPLLVAMKKDVDSNFTDSDVTCFIPNLNSTKG